MEWNHTELLYAPRIELGVYQWKRTFLPVNQRTWNNDVWGAAYNRAAGHLRLRNQQGHSSFIAMPYEWIWEEADPFLEDDDPANCLRLLPDTAHETAELLLQLVEALGPPLQSAQFCAESKR